MNKGLIHYKKIMEEWGGRKSELGHGRVWFDDGHEVECWGWDMGGFEGWVEAVWVEIVYILQRDGVGRLIG